MEMPPLLALLLAERPAEIFAPGQTLIAPNAAPTHLWYVRSGLVRVYSLSADGGEFNHDFLGDGDWVVGRIVWRDAEVCCSDRALGAAALQPTAAVRVGVAELAHWRATDPAAAAYMIDRLVAMTATRYGREADLAQRSAEDRYRELLRKKPGLLDTVALREVAAWLAITPIALSRIRRRLRG
jgi:CRP-like cAMP-binding protein